MCDSKHELEQSVLGAALQWPEVVEECIARGVTAAHFSKPAHCTIWNAIEEVSAERKIVEPIMVANKLDSHNKLEAIGGRTYLGALIESASPGSIWRQHLDAIIVAHDRGLLIRAARTIADPKCSLTYEEIETHLNSAFQQRSGGQAEWVSLGSMISTVVNRISGNNALDEGYWIQTRVTGLNKTLTGIRKGEVTIIAAEPSMGKTMLAFDTCLYNERQGVKSLYVSIDQTADSLVERAIIGGSGIPKHQLYTGSMTADEERKFGAATAGLSTYEHVNLCDDISDIYKIIAMARRMSRTVGLDMIVIDYVQLVRIPGRFENRNLELTEISRIIKEIAKELNVAVVLLSQLSRLSGAKRVEVRTRQWAFPELRMLRDSGALEQDANVVLFPHSPYEMVRRQYGEESAEMTQALRTISEFKDLAYIVVAKHKDGPIGIIECRLDRNRMRFYSPLDDREQRPAA